MNGVIPPLPLCAFMAPTGTSFCFDLRLRLQYHISSFIVVYFCLSSHPFAPYLSVIPGLPFFVSAIYAPICIINFRLLCFWSSFLLNFVLYLCVFLLFLYCTFPSPSSLLCRFPIIASFNVCLRFTRVFTILSFNFVTVLLMTVSLCHCIPVFSLLLLLSYSFLILSPILQHSTTQRYSVSKSKHNKLIVTMLLIERHVSAYSEAIIRFNKL